MREGRDGVYVACNHSTHGNTWDPGNTGGQELDVQAVVDLTVVI